MILSRWRRGRRAEELAARYLASRGLKVIGRNVHFRGGELDILAREGETLCVVEVRSRWPGSKNIPEENFSTIKRRRLTNAVTRLLLRHRLRHVQVRLDLLVVDFSGNGETPEIRHYPGAIRAPER